MKTSAKTLHYRLIPFESAPLADFVTVWTVSEADRSIGFVVSTYRNQTTPEGRHSTPLKWGYVSYKNGVLSSSECIFDTRDEAGQLLKASLSVNPNPTSDEESFPPLQEELN